MTVEMNDPRCMCPSCTLRNLSKVAAFAASQHGGEFRAPIAAPPELFGVTFSLTVEGDEVVARVLTDEQAQAFADREAHGGHDA